MVDGTLIITDGTKRVNMLGMYHVKSGIQLEKWNPGRLQVKSGGIWNDSLITDFSTIVGHRWATIVDTFTYNTIGGCTDDIVYYSQEFDRLLIQGIHYWEQPSSTKPVWIEKRGSNETNTSYAIIYGFRFPEDNDPFNQPMVTFVRSFQTKMTMAIEHGPWQDRKPFEYNNTPAGAVVCSNYIINPSFEVWGVPPPVLPTPWVERSSPTLIIENENQDYIRSGTKSVGFNNTAGQDRGIAIVLAANDTTLIYSVDVYVVSGQAFLAVYDPAGSHLAGGWAVTSGPGWHTLSFVNGGYTPATTEIRIGTTSVAGGEVYFDDIQACRLFGIEDSIEPSFVANKSNQANLTHIYLNSGAAWSNNKMDVTASWIVNGGTAADYTLFGISATAPDSGPFNSLVFDLIDYSKDSAAVNDLIWEYWNGGAWATLTVMDHTDDGTNGPMSNPDIGVLSVHWEPPADWATKAENGVTAWWVRLYINSMTGVFFPHHAEQRADTIVYTVTWPFIEVNGQDVGGDIDALAEMIFANKSDGASPIATTEMAYQRLVMGLRDLTRGDDFNAYINVSDIQQPSHIATAVSGVDTVWTNFNNSPTGRIAVYSSAGASGLADEVTITIDGKHAWQYFGLYRVYMRVRLTGTQVYNNLIITPGPAVRIDTAGVHQLVDYAVLDFGILSIPGGSHAPSDIYDDITITLQLGCAGLVTAYKIFDLIFIPADQAIYDFLGLTNQVILGNDTTHGWTQLDMDSARNPKKTFRTLRQKQSDDSLVDVWTHSVNRPMILKPNKSQKIWVMGWSADVSSPVSADANGCGTAKMRHIQRYTGMRGNR